MARIQSRPKKKLPEKPGFPIQTSAGQWIFAPHRSFSQLITSFIGS